MSPLTDPGRNDSTEELLARSPVFGRLEPSARVALAGAMRRRDVTADEVLVHEGGVSDGLFVVETGSLRVCLRPTGEPEIVIDTIGPG
ncbi:MAG: cyclic nucleotide-binding domain-containing protein, partial [Streptomyces sp.]|nr:cyclic nucleotide-binding domain-containing protein [Streptomyces sp.]